jgi:hypothetical protein
MGNKVRVVVDSTFPHGVILRGRSPVTHAYDAAHGSTHEHPRTDSVLTLHPGINEVDADEIEAWRTRAADAGLIFSRARDVLVLSNGVPGARPSAARPRSLFARALASDRIVSAR